MILALVVAARVAIVDVGSQPATPAVRAAVETALRGLSVGDAALRDALFGLGPVERARMEGEAALGRAQAAFGKLDCAATEHELDAAEKALGQFPLAQMQGRLTEIYRYREVCARERKDEAQAERFRAIREALAGGTTPSGTVTLRVQPEPEDATIYVDGRDVGRESTVAPGLHVVDVEKSGYRKLHRTLDVQPPGPVQLAASLAPEPPDPQAEVRAQVQAMRGLPVGQHLREISDIASRASADRVLLLSARGDAVYAALFDADAGTLEPRNFKGKVAGGTVEGLAAFVSGDGAKLAQKPATTVRRPPPGEKHHWSHWYTWVVAGALAGLATVLVVSATSTNDELIIRSSR